MSKIMPASSTTATLSPEIDNLKRPMSLAERHFLRAMLYTVVVVFVFWCGYFVEREILKIHPGDKRFIREATEAAMRYITIPHVIIGFLFMVTSLKNRTAVKRMWMVALLIVGAGLCILYWKGGAKTNVLLAVGVYLYFVIHELRDESSFYFILGDAPPVRNKTRFNNMIRILIGLNIFLLASLSWMAAPFGIYFKKMADPASPLSSFARSHSALFDGSMPWGWKIFLAAGPLVSALIGLRIALGYFAVRQGYASIKEMVYTHAPLFRVMIGVSAVLGLSLLLTQRAYSLITFHVLAWYVFATYQFSRHSPKQTPKSLWHWMRTTVRGFKTLHIGMVIVLIAIGLVWTLAMHQSSSLKWLLAPESFLYWTIMHITVSFVPR